MPRPEHRIQRTVHRTLRKCSKEAQRLARREFKRGGHKRRIRLLKRFIKAALAMFVAAMIIIPSMIAAGLLLGPRGVEGLIAAPLAVILSWAAILYWFFGRKRTPRLVAATPESLALLPARTDEWLDEERHLLPAAAQDHLDQISQQLEALAPQLESVDPQAPAAAELRRLLGEELPDLVRGYRKVPAALARQPLYDGPTPERQLVEGLETIERQIGRVHERLAADDLRALATHQRYLELKYKRGDDDESSD